MNLDVHVEKIQGSQMAAKIIGKFSASGMRLDFMAIAFGRIGGQNVGVKLSEQVQIFEKRRYHKDVIETINKNAESIKKLLANMIEIIPKTYSCVCRNALDEARF